MSSQLRIFVSSPGDVREERLRAQLIIAKLDRDYGAVVRIIPYFWESEPLRAGGHFQDEIEPPSTHDIVVFILWSRLGTPLPERTAVRAYAGIDGRTPVTGTEWEFEDALAAFQTHHAPDLLVYRRTGDPGASLTDAILRAEQERQWQALQAFWTRHFEDQGTFHTACARYDTLESFDVRLESDLAKLIERHIRARAEGAAKRPLHLRGSPYRGLSAYDYADAPVFFGRDGMTRTGLVRLSAAAARGCAFLMVLGASGSGKSSLARAGLLPALTAAKAVPGVGLWRRVVMRPGDAGADPVLALAAALLAGDPRRGEGLAEAGACGIGPVELAAHLRVSAADASYPLRTALRAAAERERGAKALLAHEEARLVLLVDQLEELFTRPDIPAGERALFGRILTGLARSGAVWVITTMRSDLWHRAAEMPDLLALSEKGSRLDLLPPDGAEMLEVIRRPAGAAGLGFEEDEARIGLDAVLAEAAASEPGALPLLSVLLEDLYRRDVTEADGRQLTAATYRSIGGLKGAIATRAEAVWRALDETDSKAAAALPEVLRALVSVSAGDAVSARQSPLAAFPAGTPARRLIEALLAPDVRLLTVEGDGQEISLRLAHEALVEHWPRAKAQIGKDRRDLETRSRIENFYKRFEISTSARERRRALLTGLALEEAQDLKVRWNISANNGLGSFVHRSGRYKKIRQIYSVIGLSTVFALFIYFGPSLYQTFEINQRVRSEGERTDLEGQIFTVPARINERRDGTGLRIDHSPFSRALTERLTDHRANMLDAIIDTNKSIRREFFTDTGPSLSINMNSSLYLFHQPKSRQKFSIVISCDYPHTEVENKSATHDGDDMENFIRRTNLSEGHIVRLRNPSRAEILDTISDLQAKDRAETGKDLHLFASLSSGQTELMKAQSLQRPDPAANTLIFMYISATYLEIDRERYILTRFERDHVASLAQFGKDDLLAERDIVDAASRFAASVVILDGFQSKLKLESTSGNENDSGSTIKGLTQTDVEARGDVFVSSLRNKPAASISPSERERMLSIVANYPSIDLPFSFEKETDFEEINEDRLSNMNTLGRALSEPSMRDQVFLIAAHTNASENDEESLRVSEYYAEAIKKYLVKNFQISESNLISIGYGKTHLKYPDNPNGNENNLIHVVNIMKYNRKLSSSK